MKFNPYGNNNLHLVPEYIDKLVPYQPGKTIEEVMREYGLKKILKLASNENSLGVSPKAAQEMIDSMGQIHRYPDIASKLLREKLCKRFNTKFENTMTGNGSESLMLVALRTFVHGSDELITSEGTFVGIYVMAKAQNISMVLVPLKNYRYDLEGIANRINKHTKMIYLANPDNPTGAIFTKSEFEAFMEKVPPNVLVMLDEAYYEFVCDNPVYPDSMNYRFDNVITLRTFSKAYGLAGIRLGYGFAEEYLVKSLLKVRLPFEPGKQAQTAGVAALNDGEFLGKYLKINEAGKQYIYSLYDELGIGYIPSEGNFVMSIHESEERVVEISGKLIKYGIIVRPLKHFGLPNCIRVTTGLPDEMEIFGDALRKSLLSLSSLSPL